MRNAAIIYQVGRNLGASNRDIQIALITALTESNLINVNYGDRDSLGLFQQRAAWAPAGDRMDPWKAARMFFLGGQQGQRGLFDFKDRNQMGMGEAAQAVQVSAFPDRYAEWIPLVQRSFTNVAQAAGADVRDMDGRAYGGRPDQPDDTPRFDALEGPEYENLDVLGTQEYDALAAKEGDSVLGAREGADILGAPTQNAFGAEVFDVLGPRSPLGPESNKAIRKLVGENNPVPGKGLNGTRAAIVEMAREYVGTPYVWGGASPDVGFDCSGIIQYVYGKLGVELPRVSYQQANSGKRVGLNRLRAGDLVAWDNSSRNVGADHIAIYIGNGQILEAPQPGQSVRIRSLGEGEGAWGVKLDI